MHGYESNGDADPGPEEPTSSTGLVFWLLIGLAAAGFAPCVVLPIWREYQAVALVAQIEERQTATMRLAVERQRETLEAIRTDPGVAARLAQRELGYRRPGEQRVDVPGVPTAFESPSAPPLEPVSPPQVVSRMVAHLPPADFDSIFCREPTRTVVMLLSGGVAVAAFVLCPAPRRTGPSRPSAQCLDTLESSDGDRS